MLTIVTLFINLYRYNPARAKSLADYMKWAKHILRLPFNMVIYVDATVRDEVYELRAKYKLQDKTKIILYDLTDSAYYMYLAKINATYTENRQPATFNKEKDSPEYVVTTWSKLDVLCKAIQGDYFGGPSQPHQSSRLDETSFKASDDIFAFIDFGLFHSQEADEYDDLLDIFKSISDYKGKAVHDDKGKGLANGEDAEDVEDEVENDGWDRDKIRAMFVQDTSLLEIQDRDKYYSEWRYKIAGRFICGKAQQLLTFRKYFDDEITKCLAVDRVSLEEGLWGAVYAQHKEMFDLYHGDYNNIIDCYFDFNPNGTCLLSMLEHAYYNNLYETVIKYAMLAHNQILDINYFMHVKQRYLLYQWLSMASLRLQQAGYLHAEGHDLFEIENMAIKHVVKYKSFAKDSNALIYDLQNSADKFGYKECQCLDHKLSDEVVQCLNNVLDSKLTRHQQHMLENVISDFID